MGLSRSLISGASSLRAQQQRFDVISNNLANTNTIGYKSSRMTFVDQFNQTYFFGSQPDAANELGGSNPRQFGLGVRVGSITPDMTQGVLESTNRPLDLALQGDGFFVFNQNGRQLYSRAGALSHDRDGFMVDSTSNALLQGYNIMTDGNGVAVKDAKGNNILNPKLTNVQIKSTTVSPPSQTKNVNVSGNINSQMAATDSRSTSINIYDRLGAVHSLTLVFTPDVANPNNINVAAQLDGTALTLSGTAITFNPDGSPVTTSLSATTANLNAVVAGAFSSDLNIGLASSTSGITKYAGQSTISLTEQDGFQSGELLGMSVDQKGVIWGAFSNGRNESVGQVAMAKFANPQGLIKEGNNLLSYGPNSGSPVVGTAVDIFPSSQIISGSLEQSNVDMTEQFTDMIQTQRAYEAAARTITVSDQMLQETNMLKR